MQIKKIFCYFFQEVKVSSNSNAYSFAKYVGVVVQKRELAVVGGFSRCIKRWYLFYCAVRHNSNGNNTAASLTTVNLAKSLFMFTDYYNNLNSPANYGCKMSICVLMCLTEWQQLLTESTQHLLRAKLCSWAACSKHLTPLTLRQIVRLQLRVFVVSLKALKSMTVGFHSRSKIELAPNADAVDFLFLRLWPGCVSENVSFFLSWIWLTWSICCLACKSKIVSKYVGA